jgi:hypothetical protein
MSQPATKIESRPPGSFVSDQHQHDCARFIAHAKALARRRAEAKLVRAGAAARA